ncbi:hypothetical protein HY025_04480 [Candidatus Daviesbacteria bacterium]|nr:hypothetical protein [Candidatus Daviesbacteria bacterium]
MKNKILFLIVLLIAIFFIFPLATKAQQKKLNLSSSAKESINSLAKNILTSGYNPKIIDIKTQLDPGDYKTVKEIGLLPDSPFYFLKELGRNIRLFFISTDSIKAYQKLKDGNEKTLESLLLIEKPIQKKIQKNISS